MKVLLTDNANNDIQEFASFSLANDKNITAYIIELLNYSYTLGSFPELGKFVFTLKVKNKTYNVRRLVYKEHNILYYIDTAVHIIGILYTRMDQETYIKRLKKYIDIE